MNFIEEFKKGQTGFNTGLNIGISSLHNAINGMQRHRIYGIASPAKVGKTTLVDYCFLINPYLQSLEEELNIEWIYYSYEIDRISKEFDFATFFLNYDFGIEKITLEEGQLYTSEGITSNIINLSPDYLRGRLLDTENRLITVKSSIVEALKTVYEKRIIPIFGEYSAEGVLLRKGKVIFIEHSNNPTGINKQLRVYAEQHGKFVRTEGEFSRITGYHPNDPNKFTIVIMDHLRKLIPEQGFSLKQTIDKMTEYFVQLRNWCDFTIIPILHTNRNISSVERLRFSRDQIYPTAEDLKDSGNLAEDCDYLFTMFNPNDERYNLTHHFGVALKNERGEPINPLLRTIHIAESRHCFFPQHFSTTMMGNLKKFL